MKFLPLVWAGLWRKPVRTTLIFLQVGIAFALFGVLQGMKTGVQRAIANVRADVLFVAPAVAGGARLPIAYRQRLESIPGVKAVSYADGLPGIYRDPTDPVFVLAIDPSKVWLTLAPRLLTVRPKDLEALHDTRTGALITADLGKRYGWHVGQHIALKSSTLRTDGSGTWDFDIVGTITDHEPGEGGLIIGNYAYLDVARAQHRGTVRNFYVVVSDPGKAAAIAGTIDRTFANSPSGTRTTSLRENAQQALQSLGDLSFAIRWIVSAVLIALAFSIATMMMQSIRERTPELAVLKTVGFGDRTVFALVTAESLLVCVVGALGGLGAALIVFPLAGKYVPGLSMPLEVVGIGIAGSVVLALATVCVPGLRAARLSVADALAGR